MGHNLRIEPALGSGFGGGQIIASHADTGVLEGGSDPRKDGSAVGF
jgi:gamma-glutamyltranspeptidase/glutathione hydrolase